MRTLDGNPETAADFAQALIDDGIADWLLDTTPEEPEAPAASDTAEESTGPARDPETGRFVSTEEESSAEDDIPTEVGTEDSPEPEEGEPAEQEEEDTGELVLELDSDLENLLAKYDGDVTKALRALNDSQSLIGRQGNELGELRQQMTELMRVVQENQFNPMMFAPYQNDPEENPSGLVQEVLERAATTGHFDDVAYEQAIAMWAEDDPFGAARMDARVSMVRQMVANAPAFEGPESAAPAEASVESAMAEVVQRHPDVEQFIPAVGEIAKEFPTLRDLMASGTPSQKAGAFEELVKIAKSRTASDTSRDALKRVVLKTQEEVRKEKADAAVISAKNTSAATAEPAGVDLFYREFARATGQLSEDE